MARRLMNALSSLLWMTALLNLGIFLHKIDGFAVHLIPAVLCSIAAGYCWNGSRERL